LFYLLIYFAGSKNRPLKQVCVCVSMTTVTATDVLITTHHVDNE